MPQRRLLDSSRYGFATRLEDRVCELLRTTSDFRTRPSCESLMEPFGRTCARWSGSKRQCRRISTQAGAIELLRGRRSLLPNWSAICDVTTTVAASSGQNVPPGRGIRTAEGKRSLRTAVAGLLSFTFRLQAVRCCRQHSKGLEVTDVVASLEPARHKAFDGVLVQPGE